MGIGKTPCCDKDKVKRGPWSPEEDLKLINFIQKHGHENWRALPKQAGLLRCGKSCRLRWVNYLRLDVKRGNFSKEDEETIIRLHEELGNRWSKIASHLPGRTDNEIKNVWNTHFRKKLATKDGNILKKDKTKISHINRSSSCSYIITVSSSCVKINPEVEGFVTKKPTEKFSKAISGKAKDFKTDLFNHSSSTFEEPKHFSSSSMSSNNCNVINYIQVDIVSNPEQQSSSSFSSVGFNDANNTLAEVNKLNLLDTIFDIPLESDSDFWNMLDSLESFQSGGIQSYDFGGNQSSIFGEGCNKEAENNKWLRYLENELGLEVTESEIHNNFS